MAPTLPGRLMAFASTRSALPALRHKRRGIWQEISWGQYWEHVSATARALWEQGVRAGDHVAILSDNRPEWLYADLAAQAIGARSVGIYPTSPAQDVAALLQHSESKVLFCEGQEQVDKLMAIRERTPSVERVVVFDPRGTRGYEEPRLTEWERFRGEGHALLAGDSSFMAARIDELDPEAAAMVVYTSGTTGHPKGALISNRNVCEMIDAFARIVDASDRDLVLSYLPLCHVAEKIYSVFLPLTTGLVVHFGESIDTVQEDMREVSPTIFLGVPRIWEKIHASVTIKMGNSSRLKRALFDYFVARGRAIEERRRNGQTRWTDHITWWLGDLLIFRPLQERLGLRRCWLPGSGAAPIATELLTWFNAIGVTIHEGYGMTELSGVSHINAPRRIRLGSVGTVIPVLEQRIADDGELLVRGASRFLGYLHDDEATRATIDADGWLHTGDLGAIDGDGYLRITGRKKEILITSGGKNLSPERIENALKTSPFIKEVVAVGDARKFVAALVQIEYETVGEWAAQRGIQYTSYQDLAGKDEVVRLVEEELARCNEALARVEQIRAFRILPRPLIQDDGELTPTQKVRRKVVGMRFQELVESMYAGA